MEGSTSLSMDCGITFKRNFAYKMLTRLSRDCARFLVRLPSLRWSQLPPPGRTNARTQVVFTTSNAAIRVHSVIFGPRPIFFAVAS